MHLLLKTDPSLILDLVCVYSPWQHWDTDRSLKDFIKMNELLLSFYYLFLHSKTVIPVELLVVFFSAEKNISFTF